MESKSIKGRSTAEIAAEHIEALILEGSLAPGEPLLSERDMAARLEISRPTLRQGLKILEDRGLLALDASGGRVVAPLGRSITDPLIDLMARQPDVLDDYLDLRASLEGMAASLAATRANDVDRATLRAVMARIDRAHAQADPTEEADADVTLHLTLYEASHNVVLLQIMRALTGLLRQDVFKNRQKLFARAELRDALLAQHGAIVDAVLARDADRAGQAAQDHMIYTKRVLSEIAAAEARLEISLRRIEGGGLSSRPRTVPDAARD